MKKPKTRIATVTAALQALLDMYVAMVNSGDCGNWDPETEQQVIDARAALALTRRAPK